MTEFKLDIRNETLFPWHFQFIAALILITGVALLASGRPMVGSILLIASGFILTAASGTEIDKSKNRYREYSSFYFIIKSGKWKSFNGAEKIFINKAKSSTQMHTARTNHSATFFKEEYNGYLKLTDGTKIHLSSNRKKERLAAKLNQAASFLNCPLQDNTLV